MKPLAVSGEHRAGRRDRGHVMSERRSGAVPGGHIRLPLNLDEDEHWSALGDAGLALFVRALAYAARNLTDGAISRRAFQRLTVHLRPKVAAQVVQRLVDVGVWEVTSEGWQIAGWTDFAWSAEQVAAYRATQTAKAAAGGRAGSPVRCAMPAGA